MASDPQAAVADRAAFQFRADAGEVRAVLRRAVARFARQISADDAGTLELALAEVLNNIVEHAYAGRPDGQIRLTLARAPGALACLVEDEGLPLPGLALPAGRFAPPAARVEDLAEGGWGWALIRATTEDLAYQRQGAVNRLSFRVPLTAGA